MSKISLNLVEYYCGYCECNFFMEYAGERKRCPDCGNEFSFPQEDYKVTLEHTFVLHRKIKEKPPSSDELI